MDCPAASKHAAPIVPSCNKPLHMRMHASRCRARQPDVWALLATCLLQSPTAAAEGANGAAGGTATGQKRLWGEMSGGDGGPLVNGMGPSSMQWGSTRPRIRRKRPAAAAATGSPIVILDEDSSAPSITNSIKRQGLHLREPSHSSRRMVARMRHNPTSSPPMRPRGIAANPSIAGLVPGAAAAAGGAAAQAAALAARRRALRAAPAAAAGQRRNSNSSSSSAEQVEVDADAALARKLMQEEEDLMLAQRLMQEEEQAAQV